MPKKIVAFVAAAIVAAGSYFVYNTPIGDALAIAMNKDKAVEACGKLLAGE